jgi:hypothetical protein
MRLSVIALALGATEAPQSVPVLPEALAFDVAIFASHCRGVFCLAHHGYNIQLAIAVCQEKSELKTQLYLA